MIRILHDLLLAKLAAAYGVAPVSLSPLHNYLRDGSQHVKIEHVTSDDVFFPRVYPKDRTWDPSLLIFF